MTLEYNGAEFFGWQKQNGKRTVQGVLEESLQLVTNEKIIIEGSGRTDKGVHALGQVASFSLQCNIPLKNLKIALNDRLPSDIRVLKISEAPQDFHARFSAKRKTYKYVVQIKGRHSAIKHNLLSYYDYDVDLKIIEDASKLLIGKHNFKGFCSSETNVTNFEREIYDIEIKKRGKLLTFLITGNGFLYNMVRIIVGTLLEVGRKKLSLSDVSKALKTGDRKYSGLTMPASGLYLKKVEYV